MKKSGLYFFLLVLTMFIVGCSSKNATGYIEGQTKNEPKNTSSETSLNHVDHSNHSMKRTSIDENEYLENGNYWMIEDKKIFLENIYFAFDQYAINETNRETAKNNAVKLSNLNQTVKIKLEGNSDEWGTDEYNYALALKRAKSVKDALIADGISSHSITMVSFGESNPTCTEKTVECWKKNRRVEYKLLP